MSARIPNGDAPHLALTARPPFRMHGNGTGCPYYPRSTGAVTPKKVTPPMPRRETVIGVAAAGVLVVAIATATVRGGDSDTSIDDPIGAPTSTASESPTGGLPTTEPGPTEPEPSPTGVSETASEPDSSASDRDPTSASEPPSETASPTASPTPSPTGTATASPSEQPSEDDGDGLDDMPDTGGGPLALLGGAVAAVGVTFGRRRR